MKIKLLQDWSFWSKGTILDMHPSDGKRLIKEKTGKAYKPGVIKQIKNKIDGNNRKD